MMWFGEQNNENPWESEIYNTANFEILIFSRWWVKKNWFTKLFWFKGANPEWKNDENLTSEKQNTKQYWARVKVS